MFIGEMQMIRDGMNLKGRVAVEKNGVLVLDKPNLVTMEGREWVAARFKDTYDSDLNNTGVGGRSNAQIHYMSVGTGSYDGNPSLVDVNGTAFAAGYGVTDDPSVSYQADGTEELMGQPTWNAALQNEVDRVELGVEGSMADAVNDGGNVLDNKIVFIAEFHPDTRYGTELSMGESQFQPLCEAGLHNVGLDVYAESSDYMSGRGSAGNLGWSQPDHDRMVARVTFPTISKGPLDLIRITWTITVGG